MTSVLSRLWTSRRQNLFLLLLLFIISLSPLHYSITCFPCLGIGSPEDSLWLQEAGLSLETESWEWDRDCLDMIVSNDAGPGSAHRVDSTLCLEALGIPVRWSIHLHPGKLLGRGRRHGCHIWASTGLGVAWPALLQKVTRVFSSYFPIYGVELAIFIIQIL